MPVTKIALLRAMMTSGDWRSAIKLAASFGRLGEDRKAITRAWEAYARPAFMASIGRDVQSTIDNGIAALMRRYRRRKL